MKCLHDTATTMANLQQSNFNSTCQATLIHSHVCEHKKGHVTFIECGLACLAKHHDFPSDSFDKNDKINVDKLTAVFKYPFLVK